MVRYRLLLIALLFATSGFAQTYLVKPLNIEATYKKETRTLGGAPGKNYWQNTADYRIKINFNPDTRLLTGTVDIDYINNSPDTLKELVFKLYPNFYKKNAMRNYKVDAADMGDGVKIKKLSINQTDKDLGKVQIDGTNMRTEVSPLLSKGKLHVTVDYSYTLNKTSHVRTGQVDSGSYFIAYFFPRIAVYDDIDGWNRYQYLGNEEFYNDFCHFNADITVPGKYAVWATGDLINANEVYQPGIVKQIEIAGKADSVTDVITEADLKNGTVTSKNTFNTWKFEADNVTDLAFALSDHYLWKASSLVVDSVTRRRTRVDAVFNPIHKDYFEVVNYARKTVEAMSFKFPKWPYPYPHETVFDGLDQMEYPMMVNDNPLDKMEDEIELTDHEIFHTMFPFYMGINETKYGWMDEGWATIGEWVISPIINPTIVDDYAIESYESNAGKEDDVPIITLTPQLAGVSFLTNSYPKPGLGYMYVKDMLGDALFTKALHYYIEQWHGKHPMPYDFFNCMNTGSGMNLNWFWKNWFFDNGAPDQAITKVTVTNKKDYQVIITNIGTKMVPVDLTVHYINGTTKKIHRDVSCWKNGNKAIAINFMAEKTVLKIDLGGTYDPDVNKKDNTYTVTK
ncbi:M1 family metallopeptidase [Mucilaginibacter sp. HMF5004]|uniref:M1 family metallopeptidase n=1 Tax=Mucilaginibacter rivuli TaxID=2857527 RepID=UPI001C606715|nr:M1 family metallopeptidase [Mucilaginibacter rivuli]MBW4890108.1 M1 family metallopeptidase [Mucilaginibacter rivuli]